MGSSNKNTVTLSGYWASADIDNAGGMMAPTLRAKIYGVSQSDMNSTCTLQWQPGSSIRNTVMVYAIDGLQSVLVFSGIIVNAWGDYETAPATYLMIQAVAAYDQKLNPVPPRSYKGQVDVATVAAQIAKDMGYSFENNGVNIQMSDVYLANTNFKQLEGLCDAAGCCMGIDNNTIVITPRNTPRTGLVPLVSKDSGMIGYPICDRDGRNFPYPVQPSHKILGSNNDLQSEVLMTSGKSCSQWIVYSMSHHLNTQPAGSWFSQVRGIKGGPLISK